MRKFSITSLGGLAAFGFLLAPAVAAERGEARMASGAPMDTTVTVVLEPVQDAVESGLARFEGTAEGTALQVEVQGIDAESEPLVALLVVGSCEEPGEVRASLGELETDAAGEARGAFLLTESLEDVLAVPTAVQLQAQGLEATPVACGVLAPFPADLPVADPAATPIPEPIPADDEVAEEDEDADADAAEDTDVAEDADETEAGDEAQQDTES